MNRLSLVLAAAAACFPAAAFAQDDASETYFSGPFIGVQAGWGQRQVKGIGIDKQRSGVDYGAFAGYDLRLGQSIVAGAQAAIGDGGKTLSQTIPGVGANGVEPGWNWTVTGRAGVLVTRTILAYGRVGYGRERVRSFFPSAAGISDNEWLDGAVFGGGVEYALNRSLSVRAEYRYSDFDRDYNTQQLLAGVSFRF